MAAESTVAIGLAHPLPAMSGAEPWTGSYRPLLPSPRLAEGSSPMEPLIMAAFEDGMTVRGYRKVDDPESADFVLSFTVGSREEIKVNSYPASYQGFYGHPRSAYWGGAYYGYGMATETQVRQYQKGMLALDVFDVKERRPVYHSVAEKSITDSDRKKLDETVNAAVAAVLEAFPPQ